MKKIFFSITTIITLNMFSQPMLNNVREENPQQAFLATNTVANQFISTSYLLDAAMNSFNSMNSLIKKENYRNKITSFNNPTSSDMGFNLENEIQTALKPLLVKKTPTRINFLKLFLH